ncbi:enoyl-CoA hydratase/isomerase family protein [Nocardia sp. NPDC005366]|uniref:enoyl-CoA hydratase/isomerase family protein n=1 Tax=Nocardia sp. NPDC005366 TaxID=3156878 RepID=UPI0033B92496
MPSGPLIAIGFDLDDPASRYWLDNATITLTETESTDPRVVTVDSIDATLAEIAGRCARSPLAATICDDVLRATAACTELWPGLALESLAYSTLQAGPEFERWLSERGPARTAEESAEAVLTSRSADTIEIWFNRPHRHNAFDNRTRAGLLDALTVARLDPSVRAVHLRGAGPSFCSGGDLAEFGTFVDPAASHVARTRHSPAQAIDELTRRLGRECMASVHGRVLGSGLEMASFFGTVRAHPDTVFGLPELDLGLIPGAGGTVSVTRRIGRWRTAYLVLSGRTIPAATALAWGLVDEIGE